MQIKTIIIRYKLERKSFFVKLKSLFIQETYLVKINIMKLIVIILFPMQSILITDTHLMNLHIISNKFLHLNYLFKQLFLSQHRCFFISFYRALSQKKCFVYNCYVFVQYGKFRCKVCYKNRSLNIFSFSSIFCSILSSCLIISLLFDFIKNTSGKISRMTLLFLFRLIIKLYFKFCLLCGFIKINDESTEIKVMSLKGPKAECYFD